MTPAMSIAGPVRLAAGPLVPGCTRVLCRPKPQHKGNQGSPRVHARKPLLPCAQQGARWCSLESMQGRSPRARTQGTTAAKRGRDTSTLPHDSRRYLPTRPLYAHQLASRGCPNRALVVHPQPFPRRPCAGRLWVWLRANGYGAPQGPLAKGAGWGSLTVQTSNRSGHNPWEFYVF